MDKQKEIEKIKTIMGCDYDYCESCYTHSRKSCSLRPIAERLVDAGYGDVRAAVKEFAEKFKTRFFFIMATNMRSPIYQCTGDEIDRLVNEVCGDGD